MHVIASERLNHWRSTTAGSLRQGARWVWQGLVEIGHNSLAVLGLVCIGVALFFSSDSALRQQVERQALEWLNLRHGVLTSRNEDSMDLLAELSEPEAVARATARQLKGLPRNQALVTTWLARRYRVAPEAVARLVQEAWSVGTKAKVEPALILAIMAIESSFNPFAQSSVGAQGLMQVMTQVHDDKYSAFGGTLAAFDPLTNLRVGVQVLRECIAKAGGDVELGLKYYVGAANLPTDGGYADKVMGERAALLDVAAGVNLASTAVTVRAAAPAAATAAQDSDSNLTRVASAKTNAAAATSAADYVAAAGQPGGLALAAKPSAVAPAAHAAAGTVMAPALGAALAANLSAAAETPAPATALPAKKPAVAVQTEALAAKLPPMPTPIAARGAAPGPDLAANLPPIKTDTRPAAAMPAPAAQPANARPIPAKPDANSPSSDGRVAMALEPLR